MEEWYSLPWWQQRMYIDGFIEEGLIDTGEGPVVEEAPMPDVPESAPRADFDPVMASRSELASLGLTVIDGGRI